METPGKKMGGGEKLYGKDLHEFNDKDIESLLTNLTTEELEDLNNDFDPDVNFLIKYKQIFRILYCLLRKDVKIKQQKLQQVPINEIGF